MNLPLGLLALAGVALYLSDSGEKKQKTSIDVLGALSLTIAVTALLSAFLMAGRDYHWLSIQTAALFFLFLAAGALFCHAERKAEEPILPLEFFWRRQFSLANGSAFFSSFAIFSLSAFGPLFIQEVLGKGPAELGLAMIPLSLGWSAGAMLCGILVSSANEKGFSVWGSFLLVLASGLALIFSTPSTPVIVFSGFLALAGVGMGFVSVPTLLLVQKSLTADDLGVATSSQQFSRTLGGTIGIGISGGLVAASVEKNLGFLLASPMKDAIAPSFLEHLSVNAEGLFNPAVVSQLAPQVQQALHTAIGGGVKVVFCAALTAAMVSLVLCLFLPSGRRE
jgi:Na+/melibiose symporter-like transporter